MEDRAQRDKYTTKRYHQPSDEYTADMDFSTETAMARFCFPLGRQAFGDGHGGLAAGRRVRAQTTAKRR
jgi:hypothetical protein